MSGVDVTVVLVTYNMGRELPRTLQTLSPENQTAGRSLSYEVLVVDNGSAVSVDRELCSRINQKTSFIEFKEPTHSPVPALNYGISVARGSVICACIDAARMVTPGLIKLGHAATRTSQKAVVGTLSYHIGTQSQDRSVSLGYDQVQEDRLLKQVNWKRDSYELYNVSVFDPSSENGFFSLPAETNTLIMGREMWRDNKFDERFSSKGGGLANLELWNRLCADPDNSVIMLLGEGSFHQYHGGVTTNKTNWWKSLAEEYQGIVNAPYAPPDRLALHFGSIGRHAEEFYKRRGSSFEGGVGRFRKLLRKGQHALARTSRLQI